MVSTSPFLPCRPLIAPLLGLLLLVGCSAQRQLELRWYPLVADFFAYFENPVVGSQESEFLGLFTDRGRERFLARSGGIDGFRLAAARRALGDEFPWPGRFQSFALGLGRILAPVEYDTEDKSALVTTLVTEEAEGLRLARARLYRLRFAPGMQMDEWLIDDVEYLREDPTVSNVRPLYVWALIVFMVFNLIALVPAVLLTRGAPQFAIKWLAVWYGFFLKLYLKLLNGILDFGGSLLRRLPLNFFMLVFCPLLFFGLAWLFATFAPALYNSHIGLLLLLVAACFVVGLAMLRETGDHYLVRQWQAMGRLPAALQALVRRRVQFNEKAHRRVSMLLVVLLIGFVVLGFWPYRNKFKLSATSRAALEFAVGSEVEVLDASPLYRLPIAETQYVVGRAAAGDLLPAVKRVDAEAGSFYRVVYRRRSLAYLPAAAGSEQVRSIEFELEGEFLNYLEALGEVPPLPEETASDDPEERLLAQAFVDEGRVAARSGTLQGLTRALNEYQRATDYDPSFGEAYVHRAHALASIARFLREDSLYNVFGLWGEAVPNPEKVNPLFRRALENLARGARLEAPAEGVAAVEAIAALYRGEPGLAGERLAAARTAETSRDPYVLQARMMTAATVADAVRWAEELQRVEPDDVRALTDRGLLQLRRDPEAARASFAQAARVSPGFLDGAARLGLAELLVDRDAGVERLSRLVAEETNFPYKPRFYLRHERVNRVMLFLMPVLAAAWLYALVRLVWKPKQRQHSVRAGAVRILLLLAMLAVVVWILVPRTLPAYGAVRDWLPPIWAALG